MIAAVHRQDCNVCALKSLFKMYNLGCKVCGLSLHHLCQQSPCGRKTRFCGRKLLGVCGEFSQGVHGSCRLEQGVVLALRKSHHQGPRTFATVTCDPRCHKGLPLRVPMVLPEECFGGRFPVCLECIVFQGFRLRATLRADLRADIERGQ